MLTFRYDAALLARFPTIVGGVILARGLRNGPTAPTLLAAYQAEQRATIQRLGATPLSQVASLAAWRRAFSAFGVEPTQYRSAAEALLRRLTKQGDIPSINHLVDLGNLVSIRHALPVAVFDARAARGAVTVRFADGGERFTPLGQPTPEHPAPGEVIFADDDGEVLARRWCWRQSAASAARDDTQAAIITVEAHHADGRAAIAAALDDLLALLRTDADGPSLLPGVLDAATPTLTG